MSAIALDAQYQVPLSAGAAMKVGHLLESQVRELDTRARASGIPDATWQWVAINGHWAGYLDATAPAMRYNSTSKYYFSLAEIPDDPYAYGPQRHRGHHGVSYSPGSEHQSEDAFYLSWDDVLDRFDRWLSYIRRELGLAPPNGATKSEEASPTMRPIHKAESAHPRPVDQQFDPRKVFIIHGHDDGNTMRLKELLSNRFNLTPVVLRYQPGKGRTIIEKFEDEARSCGFAFAIITPDDEVSAKGSEYLQARPNVVFELGWFYGRVGRGRVVLLTKRGVKIHSDLDGISRVEFDRTVDEALIEIERELVEAGLFQRGA